MSRAPRKSPLDPRTRAESTHYRETSRHSDVLEFIRALAIKTDLMQVDSMGASGEGQDMPVLVLSGTKTFTPEEAHRRKKTVVLVIANIHAGEVEGKEACLMLARDLTLGKRFPFLNDIVLVLIPNYNPDGNDKIDPKNRALDLKNLDGQIGPIGGVGTRYTGTGINLNRDYTKLEAIESRHLLRLIGRWKPHLTIDCHTTDGSVHGCHLTFDTSHTVDSGPREPILYVRDTLLPTISKRLAKRTGFRTFFYGNWRDQDDPTKGWETYCPLPRYGSHYRGLTGRMDILLEAYSYVDFKTRTVVMVATLLEILGFAHENRNTIRKIIERAEQNTIERGRNPQPDDRVGINYGISGRDTEGKLAYRYPAHLLNNAVFIWGWDKESQKQRRIPGKKLTKYTVPHYARFVPEVTVRRPFAYLIPAELGNIAEQLRLHNIGVDTLAVGTPFVCESYIVLGKEATHSPDVGTATRSETVLWVRCERGPITGKKGDAIVRTSQPLAHVAIYLLEPQSDDGLVRWNFFDDLSVGDTYPIHRIPDPGALTLR